LNCHVSILDFRIVLVRHLSQIRIDVIKTLLVFLEDEVVVILIHLTDLSLFVQLLLHGINWSLVGFRRVFFLEGKRSKVVLDALVLNTFWHEWLGVKIEKVLAQVANQI